MLKSIKKYYDLIIIGAGPAGSVTGRFAAENGCSVLIVERDREPGVPVRCAEGVSHNGILPFITINPKWICSQIDGASLHAPNGQSVEMYNNGTGYVLDRRVFDRELSDLAVAKGATLITKTDAVDLVRDNRQRITGVIIRNEKEYCHINCQIVIGADGIESQVGKWAGINTNLKLSDLDTCCQYTVNNIKIDAHLCHFYFGKNVAPGGYLWVFPKSQTQANIGIGIGGQYAEPNKGPRYYLDQFMDLSYPQASINYMVYGGVPTSAGNNFIKDNVMLVGDAARQVNPITGGGVVQAMIAGQYCGETAAKAIKHGIINQSVLQEYASRWENHLGKNQRFLYELKNKFMGLDDRNFNKIVEVCQRIPQTELNMQTLFKETIKDDPLLVARLATDFIISKIRA